MDSQCSVAMATYNGQAYLLEQLESISQQTIKPFELIICDDGSTDDTCSIVQNFALTAPFPVRLEVNETKLGFQRNFMKAISLCSGAFLCFADQDDIWNPSKISKVQEFFSTSDCVMLAHDFTIFFEDLGRENIKSYFSYLAESGFSKPLSIKGCTLSIRRDTFDKTGWPPEASRDVCAHDNWVCFVSALMEKQGYIDDLLIQHRIHNTNTSGAIWGGRSRLQQVLRRIHLPPFTSRRSLDVLFSYLFHNIHREIYFHGIKQCAAALTTKQLKNAQLSYKNRITFLDFPENPKYSSAIIRIPQAFGLFLSGVYRTGDGVLGLFNDVFGKRQRDHSVGLNTEKHTRGLEREA